MKEGSVFDPFMKPFSDCKESWLGRSILEILCRQGRRLDRNMGSKRRVRALLGTNHLRFSGKNYTRTFSTLRRLGVGVLGREVSLSGSDTNWLGKVLDRTNSSNMTVKEGLGEINKWKPALTDEEWHRANLTVLDDTLDDKLMCTLTSSGKFKISRVYQAFSP